MKIIEFLFGWLIKEQYKLTILDGFIFYIELILLISLFFKIINNKDTR